MTDRISSKQYRKLGKRTNKYGVKRTRVNGIWFDSRKEAERYKLLKSMQMAREITDLELQPEYVLHVGEKPLIGDNRRPRVMRLDFRYKDSDGVERIEDVKSPATKTPLYRLKKQMVEAWYRVKVEEV